MVIWTLFSENLIDKVLAAWYNTNNTNAVMRISTWVASLSERRRSVKDVGEDLPNSPRSGRAERICVRLGADGTSRDRVKVCRHLRASVRTKKSGTAEELKFSSFVSLQSRADVGLFLIKAREVQ